MKQLRYWVPLLSILALILLFFKLPEAPNPFGIFGCKTCSSNTPYLVLGGAGYFAILLAVSWLFPAFPSVQVARGGLTWAVLLALVLTYLYLPTWCISCLIAHLCNILIWTIWVFVPPGVKHAPTTLKERLCLTLIMPVSLIALFSCLNLTFMAYNHRINHYTSTAGLQSGDTAPTFNLFTLQGNPISSADPNTDLVLNFVSPKCSHCKEQLPIFNAIAAQLANGPYRFVNVSPTLQPELIQLSPNAEWVEDKDNRLRESFKVLGYPTIFVLGTDGKIAQIIRGVSEHMENDFLTILTNENTLP
jgi:thiol-disulfide isomerase/thioredoxin